MAKTLREISAELCTTQPHQIDSVLEGTPLLDRIPFVASTHGLTHAFEKIQEVDAAAFVNIDQPLPGADVTTELGKKDLNTMGFTIEAGIDHIAATVGKGNFSKYLAKKTPKIFNATGMKTEAAFIGLLKKYAVQNGQVINAGGTGTKTYSIFATRFVEDEVCGLYDEEGFGDGAFFDTIPIAGGNPYKNKEGKTVYGADFKTHIQFLLENPKCVSAIVNIDEEHPIKKEMMNKLLKMARAGDIGQILIFGHPDATEFIDNLKMSMVTQGTSINTLVENWNKVEIISTWNGPTEEPAITLTGNEVYGNMNLAGDLIVDGEVFFDNAELATATSKALNLGKGAQLSGVLIKGIASGDVAAGSGSTIELQQSDKKTGTYETIYKKTLNASYKDGEVFYEYVPTPSFKGWAKVVLTAAEGATGKVSVYPTTTR